MKHLISILISAAFAVQILSAQDWHLVNTNTTENLYDIFFVDSLEGYCVGGGDNWGTPQSKGVILKTTNGGEDWSTIFSKDSLTILDVAVVSENGYIKLYAFALENGQPHLVSTFLNTMFQNWSITPVSYKPKGGFKLYGSDIYFVDEFDENLKRLSNNQLTQVVDDVSIFDVNSLGLLWVNANADTIFYSIDFGLTIDTLNPHPSLFGQNQLSGAHAFLGDDYFLIFGTYPGLTIISFDSGISWAYNDFSFGLPVVIDENNIIVFGLGNDLIPVYITDYKESFVEPLINLSIAPIKSFRNGEVIFLIGRNGLVYKSSNSVQVSVIDEMMEKHIITYPNPTKDTIYINSPSGFQSARLFDIGGKLIRETYSKQIHVSDLPRGTFLLEVNTRQGKVIKKVVLD